MRVTQYPLKTEVEIDSMLLNLINYKIIYFYIYRYGVPSDHRGTKITEQTALHIESQLI